MFTRPDGLPDQAVVDAVGEGWGVQARRIEYLPLGFGSYHWRLDAGDERWFVTADDLAARRRDLAESPGEALGRLSAALSAARALRDAGMAFVVAPERTATAEILHAAGDGFAVALYPYVHGEAHTWGPYETTADRLAVLDLLAAVHGASEPLRRPALVEDCTIPGRDGLMVALSSLGQRWDSGPFGEPARLLLARHETSFRRVLGQYDGLAAAATGRPERMVLTHGEPHRGNTLTNASGVVLIDWDTALIAPPERDLWSLAEEDPQIVDAYTARTGVRPLAESLELYRLAWDLAEIAIYVGQFRQPHCETADTAVAWDSLNRYLDPAGGERSAGHEAAHPTGRRTLTASDAIRSRCRQSKSVQVNSWMDRPGHGFPVNRGLAAVRRQFAARAW